MQFLSISEIRKELDHLDRKDLVSMVVELSKLSQHNKAFIGIKLASTDNPNIFLDTAKQELETLFMDANSSNYHLAKKSIQGIRRKLNLKLKLSKDKIQLAELLLYFCRLMREYGYLGFRHPVIDNLYQMQYSKASKMVSGLHEDFQYDFEGPLEELAYKR